jgi:phospholipid/cholesterol/gamma-HCH transport system substrate-binding protein
MRVGLFFILGIALIWVVYDTLSDGSLQLSSGYKIYAPFKNVQQLTAGDEVRLAGVKIGNVSETVLKDGHAVVTLTIEPKYRVRNGAVATVTTAGLLGNNFVAITAGEGEGFLTEGMEIKTKDTQSMSEVITSFGGIGERLDNLLSTIDGGGTGDTGGAFSNLNNLIVENRDRIDHTLKNLEEITQKINDSTGTLGLLINDRTVYDEIVAAARDLQSVTDHVGGVFQDVSEGKGALGALLYDPQTAEDLKKSVQNILEFTDKLNSDKSTIGRLVSNDSLYVQAEDVLNKIDSAVDSYNNSGPITAIGVAAAALF